MYRLTLSLKVFKQNTKERKTKQFYNIMWYNVNMKMLSIRLAVGGMLWNNREPSKDINFGLFYSWELLKPFGLFFSSKHLAKRFY